MYIYRNNCNISFQFHSLACAPRGIPGPCPLQIAGEGRFAALPPPLSVKLPNVTGSILDPKTVFDSSGLELSEYDATIYVNVTGNVCLFIGALGRVDFGGHFATGNVANRVGQRSFFIIYHCWLRWATQPYQIEIKPMELHGSCLRCF